jgi:molybdopterin-guanine dinucleotide biosynthesis protein A
LLYFIIYFRMGYSDKLLWRYNNTTIIKTVKNLLKNKVVIMVKTYNSSTH